eukprot:CAMPEP_0197037628 /NCGR_PEP_ID=MMETSP1384-20130603/14775_1 /TAXON_ID=29189 /ORGANISM="Ammonia sp." /LENGTH=842 /DNA_ID=CAMNT_0042467951 /DNA_START=171 /DNA_END=2699 /DNA_ORIENTATION=-
MMNYQIGPTPPPMLPSLDQNEIEQTLYQRRVSDVNEALTESIQPLQISYTKQYYQASAGLPAPQAVQYSPPAQQRSAPMQHPHGAGQHTMSSAVLFSKTPQAGTAPHVSMVTMTVAKPPETPSTPPPPPLLTKSISTPARKHASASGSGSGTKPMLNAHSHSNPDIMAITPQSHAANLHNNSASNHSTASTNNTTATTVIESASHSSHSPHPQSVHVASSNAAALGKSQPAPPVLAHPLPPVNSVQNASKLSESIVIPMDQQNYNAFLTQMYGNQVPAVHGLADPYSRSNAAYPNIQDDLNDICYNSGSTLTASTAAQTFNLYGAYDSHQYGIYNAPSTIPANNGYYTNQPSIATNSYYAQPPHTAPAHVQYPGHSAATVLPPKSADPYTAYHHQAATNAYGQATAPQTASYAAPATTSGYYHTGQHVESHQFAHQSPPKVTNSMHSPTKAQEEILPENLVVHFLHRCDGTIISPHSDPMSVPPIMHSRGHKEDELDAFTAGDDALFGNNMVTIINVNWQTSIPYATVRIHISNRIHHVPLIDLSHIESKHQVLQQRGVVHKNGKFAANNNTNTVTVAGNNNRYRLGGNPLTGHEVNVEGDVGATVIRRNPKLSDETLMKLPHLRRHRDYIRSVMDTNMGPKDYNSFRVSVNTKNKDGAEEDEHSHSQHNHGNEKAQHHQHHQQQQHVHARQSNNPMPGANAGRTANIQNLNANLNHASNAGNGRKKSKRMSACEKGDLFKTELCENWVKKGHCTYGKKCHFAHGRDDIRTRWRIENYKTQPCCDPARADSRLCLFGKRCNYAHPGEPLRRSHHCLYLDEEYEAEILKDYGANTPYPFGIYI